MLKYIVFFIGCIAVTSEAHAQNWQIQPVQLQTRRAKEVTPDKPLNEYPRPQMTRSNWTNLNGLWDFGISTKDAQQPSHWDGKILVPYPLESALSGVKKQLLPSQNLWYKRTFDYTIENTKRLLLHFGALDWQTTVYLNGKEAGSHTGGYTAFTFDVTDLLKKGPNELVVKVYDPSDQGIGPHGKQVLNPKDIYYTPTSGIWQTVWLEEVPKIYIDHLDITPDLDHSSVQVKVNTSTLEKDSPGDKTVVQVIEPLGQETGHMPQPLTGAVNQTLSLSMGQPRLWSPDDPFLCCLYIKLYHKGKLIDRVQSYFGMRKIEVKKDEKGIDRIYLNNKYTYNLGVLDQGFWPEGLYTAPTDEALKFDMLVWQDMVNPNQNLPEGAKQAFEQQCKETIDELKNETCITSWVLFNEKWGQYDQKRLTDWIKQQDPTRLVNGHTGEILYVNEQLRSPSPDAYIDADMIDVHSYPNPMMPIKQANKAQVVGEFGGIGLAVPDHEWNPYTGWGYIQTTAAQMPGKYASMVEQVKLLEQQGLSGSIYTQPYDVEGEENGFMTYDRECIKIPLKQLQEINSELVQTAFNLPIIEIKDNDKIGEAGRYANMLKDYIHGNRDTTFLKALALTAQKQGDRTDGQVSANTYIQDLTAPFSEDKINFIVNFTRSTKDPGFVIIQINEDHSKKVIGEKQLNQQMMNMIYASEIASELLLTKTPNWLMIVDNLKRYGALGEEILLRAGTIDYLNRQDWEHFVPAAKEYLAKYSNDVKPSEKVMLQTALDQHQY